MAERLVARIPPDFSWHAPCSPLSRVPSTRPRIIIATPFFAEHQELADWLSANGFDPVRASTAAVACDEIARNGAATLVADVGFAFQQGLQAAWRARYPKVSSIALGTTGDALQRAAEKFGAIYLPRPVDASTLLCMVSIAIVEGRPIRCSPRTPVSFAATANGVPGRLVDISPEGLRLELPRERRTPAPPLYFRVSVPTVGIAMMVQRKWTSALADPKHSDVTWCGAALAQNSGGVQQAWKRFVNIIPQSATGRDQALRAS